MRLKDKVSIVTGAGRGIGRATAMRLAQDGSRVVVADVEIEVAKEVAKEINEISANGEEGEAAEKTAQADMALAVHVDVTSRESVDAMVKTTLDHFGRIDVLINNAGIVRDSQMKKMSEEDFDVVIDVNLKGVFNCTQAVTATMLEQGSGVILSTASVVAPFGNFGQTNYVATKAGVVGMTKVWARELGRKGIRVNAVAPGFIETRMTAGIPDKVVDKLLGRISMGRFGKPEEIANAFAWLASDDASYVTQHVLAVDGGTVI